MPTHRLFVYGTLMRDEVLRQLVNRLPVSGQALLEHYRRFRMPGRSYPGIAYSRKHRVHGNLLEGLSDAQLRRLDRYEGSEYRRARVVVQTTGRRCPAWTYVARRRA